MDVFKLRDRVIKGYSDYVTSFLTIRDTRIENLVREEMTNGFLWPDPLLQLNPSFEPGETIPDLIASGVLHPECLNIFRAKREDGTIGDPFRLHRHQVEGVRAARANDSYVLTTGTGSGKSLAYIVPIVDHVLRNGSGKGIQAIIVYPMNALANSQVGELEKFLCRGYPQGHPPVTFQRYTGQESDEQRNEIIASPPDILLTNYVMLELVLTRPRDRQLIQAAQGLRFLVLDELHTYRGRQGADVAMLVRRVREACKATNMLHVGTSATLSGGATWADQQAEVSSVASRLFGAEVKPERVIGESLRRATPKPDLVDPAFATSLRARVESANAPPAGDAGALLADPLTQWVESTLGLREEPESGGLVRSEPRPLSGDDGIAADLAGLTGLDRERCERELMSALLRSYGCLDEHGRPLFPFRLHQFVSKGEAVYASPEPEGSRHITLHAQQYVPGSDRSRILLPLVFCRECGQEYYSVRKGTDDDGRTVFVERDAADRLNNDDGEAGYLYISDENPWPEEPHRYIDRLPDTWIETDANGVRTVNRHNRKDLPVKHRISGTGVQDEGTQSAWWLSTPFRFCFTCGVTYNPRQQSDFGKLASLGSEGRSTATTILALSAIRNLRRDETLAPKARKLLSFTDNRQDASLQAGHFNDFVEIALLRAALWRAVDAAGESGIRHDELTHRVFESLALPVHLYAIDPAVKYAAREETDRALREVLGYYVYRDLRRGWRVTSPNLEQCGLLNLDYLSLDEFCSNDSEWSGCHPVLAGAQPAAREFVCRTLLDFLRRELAIRVSFLAPLDQERIHELSRQRLASPWALEEAEAFEKARAVFPRSGGDARGAADRFSYLSPRGGFGLFLKRNATFPDNDHALDTADLTQIIPDLCERLTIPGLLHRSHEPREPGDVGGYQVNAAALIWKAGEGTAGFHDTIRVPRAPDDGPRTNPFFTDFYRGETNDLKNLQAREHTAQVPSDVREEREESFRKARLPILYCSPTMELGVDISELNVVNMRNVPPTPANYAQRSGRAGRSGQPALVYSYCSSASPHDQYFFRRPHRMVAGSVTTPRLDLGNEDLLRAHVHAIWLGVSNLSLGSSLEDVLDVRSEERTLAVLPEIKERLTDHTLRDRARTRVRQALGGAIAELVAPDGNADEWIERVLDELPESFARACHRWRDLYLSALNQTNRQHRIVNDASRDPGDRKSAKRLRAEAEAQLTLLTAPGRATHSDFYSYRYFASEGFLPGYNFPRLPLSAFLPARQGAQNQHDEFLTRPRFLAISEFGPRSIIYHEGSRYVINKVILPVEGDENSTSIKRRAIQCEQCGYIHPLGDEPGPDLCDYCNAALPAPYDNLFRMQNVATRRRDRINSDEEERFRLGYEIKTGVRFARRGGVISARPAEMIANDGASLATLVYGHGATLWRMNLGWRRRRDQDQTGYLLDIERGFWARSQVAHDDPEDPMSPRQERVIPYVEDSRNAIVVRPADELSVAQMASLEAALKTAIQVQFELEDRELATEPLPSTSERRHLLLYEASEGGAGVLRRLIEDPAAIPAVARLALELSHFDPDSGEDKRHAPGAREDCEAACYDCLLSYTNQRDHRLLDRQLLPALLTPWMTATVSASPAPIPREEQLARLRNLCQSDLERKWLAAADIAGLALPTNAQMLIESAGTRPDFLYRGEGVAVFIDGPPHDTPEQRAKDDATTLALEDLGYTVIRFRHDEEWTPIFQRFPTVFGPMRESEGASPDDGASGAGPAADEMDPFDLEDFPVLWRPSIRALVDAGMSVEPGREVMKDGRVIDLDLATVSRANETVRLVDAAQPTAAAVAEALEAADERVITARHNEENLTARVAAQLER